MGSVIADISISVDGFVTGPHAGPANGLGDGGEAIHAWVFSGHEADRRQLDRGTDGVGAVVMGRNLFDVVDGPDGWNEERGYGADVAVTPPFVVVTSSPPERVRLDSTHDFTFVTDGVRTAVRAARDRAGEADVVVMGGAAVIRGCLEAGLLDTLRLHVSPLVLGAGTSLLQGASPRSLRQLDVEVSPSAVHLTYEVLA